MKTEIDQDVEQLRALACRLLTSRVERNKLALVVSLESGLFLAAARSLLGAVLGAMREAVRDQGGIQMRFTEPLAPWATKHVQLVSDLIFDVQAEGVDTVHDAALKDFRERLIAG